MKKIKLDTEKLQISKTRIASLSAAAAEKLAGGKDSVAAAEQPDVAVTGTVGTVRCTYFNSCQCDTNYNCC